MIYKYIQGVVRSFFQPINEFCTYRVSLDGIPLKKPSFTDNVKFEHELKNRYFLMVNIFIVSYVFNPFKLYLLHIRTYVNIYFHTNNYLRSLFICFFYFLEVFGFLFFFRAKLTKI